MMTETTKRWAWFALLLGVGVLTRWLPRPPNFSPILAIALFAGFVIPGPLALVLPIASLFIGDLLIGFHDLLWLVYLTLLPLVYLGRLLPRASIFGWASAGLASSLLFFATTNLGVWWSSGMYPHTQDGLVTCFVLAIPFFHNSLLATWAYMAAFEGLRLLNPNFAPQTA